MGCQSVVQTCTLWVHSTYSQHNQNFSALTFKADAVQAHCSHVCVTSTWLPPNL